MTENNAIRQGNQHVRAAQLGRDPRTTAIAQAKESVSQSLIKANEQVHQSTFKIIDGVRQLQSAVDASGGPQSKHAVRAVMGAAMNCEQVARVDGMGYSLVAALNQLSSAAKTWEQACQADGLSNWLQPAHQVADSLAMQAQTIQNTIEDLGKKLEVWSAQMGG